MCIMVVDAAQDMRQDLVRKLQNVFPGSEIADFGNSLEALKYAARHDFALLFTDVRIQPFDGYELIRILRQQNHAFGAYVVSGTKSRPDDLRWMNVNGSFSKPVSVEELMQVAHTMAREG